MSTRAISIAGFVILIGVLVLLEVLGRRKNSPIPTLGEILGYAMRPRAGRLLILAGWLWLGWHFFAR